MLISNGQLLGAAGAVGLAAAGVVLGTPAYAPPEQLRGDRIDVRADIYSVGATLYALLTGKPDDRRPQQFLMHYPHGRHRSNYFTTWRDGDWKVVYHTFPDRPPLGGVVQSGGEPYELFNLADDPYESTNLASTHPQQLRRMMGGLVAALENHKAVCPVDDDRRPLKPKLP